MREYTLSAPEAEWRYFFAEYACESCGGWYQVRGVVGPGASGPKSYAAPLDMVNQRGGWPCSCPDVAQGLRGKG